MILKQHQEYGYLSRWTMWKQLLKDVAPSPTPEHQALRKLSQQRLPEIKQENLEVLLSIYFWLEFEIYLSILEFGRIEGEHLWVNVLIEVVLS